MSPLRLGRNTVLVVALAFATNAEAHSSTNAGPDRSDVIAQKNAAVSGVPAPQPQVGGDDVATAFEIPSLPFSDTGTTCAFANDYDEACPFSGSTSADVVYRYTPDTDVEISVSLCDSGYDTKVYVYENAAGALVACNDDGCGADGFRSELQGVPLTAGNTYYVVVDGYFGACGAYTIAVEEGIGDCASCQPGWVAENEPLCGTNYVDATNGGCNSAPPVFMGLPCDLQQGSAFICGTYGGFEFDGLDYRDTDWYVGTPWLGPGTEALMCVEGEIGTLIGIIDGSSGCPAEPFVQSVVANACEPTCIQFTVDHNGPWWFFVAPSDFGPSAGECGSKYGVQIDGMCAIGLPVEPTTWGAIKSKYRAESTESSRLGR